MTVEDVHTEYIQKLIECWASLEIGKPIDWNYLHSISQIAKEQITAIKEQK